MDTLIILAGLAILGLFWKFPRHKAGIILFWTTWTVCVLLFNYHVSSKLPLNF